MSEASQSTPSVERIVLSQIMKNEEYARRVLPFLKEEYFSDPTERRLFVEASTFFTKYNSLPTPTEIDVSLRSDPEIPERILNSTRKLSHEVYSFADEPNPEWLIEQSEKFCQDRSLYLALSKSVEILSKDGNAAGLSKTAIPSLMTEALAVSFDKHVGHDYFDDGVQRFESYTKVEKKIPFGLDYMNRITNGGVTPKTLTVVMAGTGVGKSLYLCDHASTCLAAGYKVLYITCEMSEEKISERIDANLMDCDISTLSQIPLSQFLKGLQNIKSSTKGRLVVKEYPTATANSMHFRSLLNELRLKKDFVPDVIFIDYLNICTSVRYKPGANVNSYTYIKAIAEEIRGLAIEFNVPIFTATQSNRQGFSSSDPGLSDTSECIWVEEKVRLRDGTEKRIGDVVPGDQIVSQDEYKTTVFVHHPKPKDCVRITTKSGKSIVVSRDHVFPADSGRRSVNGGLAVGDRLSTF